MLGAFKLVGDSRDDSPPQTDQITRLSPVKGEDRLRDMYARHRGEAVVAVLTTVLLEMIDLATIKATTQRN